MSDDANSLNRRPLLANGERLSKKATKPGRPNNKFHPFTHDQAWQQLAPQAELLFKNVASLRPEVSGRHVVFEAKLLPNYLASSYFPADLLATSHLYVVGARTARERYITESEVREDEPTKTLLIAGRPERVKEFARMVTQPPSSTNEKEWDRLRQFSDIGLAARERVIVRRPDLAPGEVITWEAVLMHIFDDSWREEGWADENFQKWVKYVTSLGGRVDVNYRRDVQHLTFVPVELAGEELDSASQFNLLRAIRPMPQIRPLPKPIVRAIAPKATRPSVAAIEGRTPALTIAAFDGGVNPNLALFRPFVRSIDLTTEPHDPQAVAHGSLVTSALLYGPVIQGSSLPDPEACVVHHRVLPVPKDAVKNSESGVYWILDELVKTIRREKFSLVSLSLGPEEVVEDGLEPTRWTTELDVLAEAGVTFVVAAGNNGEDDPALGFNRVLAPADMINGIAVGACSRLNHDKTVRAPYSAIGPGREGQRVAPTGVAFGGSDEEPFVGIDQSGRLANSQGTSFAAPTVARGIANLWNAIDPQRRTPALSRAFAVHFAVRRRRHKTLELGHGLLPSTFTNVFECPANEVTVLYEDELARAEVVAMHFPFPTGLVENLRIGIEWTIVFTSAIDPRDASDYALNGLELVLRPNDALRTLTGPDNEQNKVDRRVDESVVRSVLAQGGRLSDALSHSRWRPKREAELRANGKWDTVVRGRTSLRSQDLYEPRLDVVHLRREEGRLVNGSAAPPLRIAMLLTLRAPMGIPLYDQVALGYPVLAPLVKVPVRIPGAA